MELLDFTKQPQCVAARLPDQDPLKMQALLH